MRLLLSDILQRSDSRTGHGTNRIEHAAVVLVQERLRGRTTHEAPQLAGVRHHQQPVEFIYVLDSRLMRLSSDRCEERACIAAPTTILSFVIRNEGSSKLLDVVVALDLRK